MCAPAICVAVFLITAAVTPGIAQGRHIQRYSSQWVLTRSAVHKKQLSQSVSHLTSVVVPSYPKRILNIIVAVS